LAQSAKRNEDDSRKGAKGAKATAKRMAQSVKKYQDYELLTTGRQD